MSIEVTTAGTDVLVSYRDNALLIPNTNVDEVAQRIVDLLPKLQSSISKESIQVTLIGAGRRISVIGSPLPIDLLYVLPEDLVSPPP